MKKIFICVGIPAVSKKYDFKIPAKMRIKDAIILMYQIIGEEFQGILKDIESAGLFMPACKIVLSGEARFLDYQIKDEDYFILI